MADQHELVLTAAERAQLTPKEQFIVDALLRNPDGAAPAFLQQCLGYHPDAQTRAHVQLIYRLRLQSPTRSFHFAIEFADGGYRLERIIRT